MQGFWKKLLERTQVSENYMQMNDMKAKGHDEDTYKAIQRQSKGLMNKTESLRTMMLGIRSKGPALPTFYLGRFIWTFDALSCLSSSSGKGESQVHTDILGLLTKDQAPCVIHTDGPCLNTADIILLLGSIFCALLQQLSVISSIITFKVPLISLMSLDTTSILCLLIQYVLCPFFVLRQELTRLTLVNCPNPDAGGATL